VQAGVPVSVTTSKPPARRLLIMPLTLASRFNALSAVNAVAENPGGAYCLEVRFTVVTMCSINSGARPAKLSILWQNLDRPG